MSAPSKQRPASPPITPPTIAPTATFLCVEVDAAPSAVEEAVELLEVEVVLEVELVLVALVMSEVELGAADEVVVEAAAAVVVIPALWAHTTH